MLSDTGVTALHQIVLCESFLEMCHVRLLPHSVKCEVLPALSWIGLFGLTSIG